MRMSFKLPSKTTIVALSLVSVSLLLLALPSILHRSGVIVSAPVSLANRWALKLSIRVREFYRSLFAGGSLRRENRQLKEEVRVLRELLAIQNEELIRTRKRLRAISPLVKSDDLSFSGSLSIVVAVVISRDADSSRASVLVDKGSRDGVSEGAPVLWGRSLVGKVVRTTRTYSAVSLISDPSFRAPAYIVRTGEEGIIRGLSASSHTLLLDYIHKKRPRVGDYVLSGAYGVYPPHLVVGRVTEVESRSESPFYRVVVEPFEDLSELREVLIIKGQIPSMPQK